MRANTTLERTGELDPIWLTLWPNNQMPNSSLREKDENAASRAVEQSANLDRAEADPNQAGVSARTVRVCKETAERSSAVLLGAASSAAAGRVREARASLFMRRDPGRSIDRRL